MAAPAQSLAFESLHPAVQKFLWAQGWSELRDIQELAIAGLMPTARDVVLAASTASGKTEAAFLPLLSQVLFERDAHAPRPQDLIVYVSPLKALINDQFSRLSLLCEHLDIPVWPWHGDIGQASKKRFLKERRGLLLITPESLEAFFCHQGTRLREVFGPVRAVVVDELHAFMEEERGKQLQSLMHRLDLALGRAVPRIGLSATLGDMRLAADFLRPGAQPLPEVIATRGGGELQVLVKGYLEPAAAPRAQGLVDDSIEDAPQVDDEEGGTTLNVELSTTAHIAQHLFKALRGSNNLVFPNTRNRVEAYALHLRSLCTQQGVPNEFFPHHGSLSRELREEAEQALKTERQAATAICTNTLELGIDIGEVKSVAQIGPPPSVASLRQRLGRSGRRDGEPSILRGYVQDFELTAQSHLLTQLREDLFEMAANITLLLAGWFEPPRTQGLHYSTLVQQLFALIAQEGGITPARAYAVLCKTGPFGAISAAAFAQLLRHFGEKEYLVQEASGLLLHGPKVERAVNHYTFYAAFATQEEYRLVCGGRTLGALPILNALQHNDLLVFAGKTWRVVQIDEASRSVEVVRTRAGKAPRFESGPGFVHTRVRQTMRTLYAGATPLPYLDATAQRLLAEGRKAYRDHDLAHRTLVPWGSGMLLFTWLGDRENQALALMLGAQGLSAHSHGLGIDISSCPLDEVALTALLSDMGRQPAPTPDVLLQSASNLVAEKWDWTLPEALLKDSYASLKLDIAGAHTWLAGER